MINLNEVLIIKKPEELNTFIKKYSGHTLDEKGLYQKDIENNWKFVGNNNSNASLINMLKKRRERFG